MLGISSIRESVADAQLEDPGSYFDAFPRPKLEHAKDDSAVGMFKKFVESSAKRHRGGSFPSISTLKSTWSREVRKSGADGPSRAERRLKELETHCDDASLLDIVRQIWTEYRLPKQVKKSSSRVRV